MPDILNLRKFVAPEIIFGAGARKLAGRYAQQFSASKVLIVTDKGVIAAGWLADVRKSLEEAGIPYHVFSNVTPNPRATEVMEGAEVYGREGCNVIVAIGGGSPMDCAKGIGIVSSNNMNILRFEGVDKIHMPVPPLILIPTTAGTSADVSQFCIISNRDELVKIAIISKALVPDVALIDPETTTTMDPYLTACTAIDALVHAMEAFVSTASGPLTDMHAIEGIKLVRQNLPALLRDRENARLREKIMLGSMKAGLAFSNAILGAVHSMSHSLGGFLDLPHGECNALLLDHVINYNYDSAPERFKIIAEAMGLDVRGLRPKEIKARLINCVAALKNEVGITRTLCQRSVKTSDIPQLAKKAIKDACLLTNPRKATKGDLEVIYGEAM
ncbi:MAG: iron-containing alcohol dehydrogenase [Desulfobacteraceae bacterium]|nr:iron-containing alcohol dehydrogenase [Desulfobacteraceae bacterium]